MIQGVQRDIQEGHLFRNVAQKHFHLPWVRKCLKSWKQLNTFQKAQPVEPNQLELTISLKAKIIWQEKCRRIHARQGLIYWNLSLHIYTHLHTHTHSHVNIYESWDLESQLTFIFSMNILGKEIVFILIHLLHLLKTILYFSLHDIKISAIPSKETWRKVLLIQFKIFFHLVHLF